MLARSVLTADGGPSHPQGSPLKAVRRKNRRLTSTSTTGLRETLPVGTLYFHAQYRQCAPCKAITSDGKNLTGENNYVWMEAVGRGHFAGVTMSVLENADSWWGEGDDMFFVDGKRLPSIRRRVVRNDSVRPPTSASSITARNSRLNDALIRSVFGQREMSAGVPVILE